MNDFSGQLLNLEERLEYIDACELPESPILSADTVDAPLRSMRLLSAVDEKNEGAAVVANNIIAFVAGISKQNKEDIKNSVLFATLVANHLFPDASGPQWYQKFNEVLFKVGCWVPVRREYSKFSTTEQHFTMDQVGLKILASAVAAAMVPGPTSLLLLGVAQQALQALQESDKPLRLFEGKSPNKNGANFSFGACIESEDGEVMMTMAAVDFSASLKVRNVLFWDWSNTSVDIFQAESHLVFNQGLYAVTRERVLQKLGNNVKQAIEEYDI
jgi:hypothetical protein